MTQYNAVKELILDLLGWGVTPEYLVKHGISRRAIYYVFTELRLKLPENFDTTGILPLHPNSVNEKSIPTEPASMRRAVMGHPLPPKPKPAKVASLPTAPPAPQPTPVVETPPAGPSLHIIEAQRRQELLARKAVIASLKKKKAKIEAVASESSEVMPMTPPSVDVDEFLKSIEAIPASLPPTPVSPTRPRNSVVDEKSTSALPAAPFHTRKDSSTSMDMDVDEDVDEIPGFGYHKRPSTDSVAMSMSNPDTPASTGPEPGG